VAYLALPDESWNSICERLERAAGPISWRWAAIRERDGTWKFAVLAVSTASPAPVERLPYQSLVIGREALSAEDAADRMRAGRAAKDSELGDLMFPLPSGMLYPRHRGTGAAGPYRSRSGWPEFEVQYDSQSATVGQQMSNIEQLVEPDLPIYPSGQDAVAHLVFETSPDESNMVRVGTVLVRLPDRRGRIASIDLRRGRLVIGLEGGIARSRLRAAWRMTTPSVEWSRHEWIAPQAAIRFPVRGIPYQLALYLVTEEGDVLDSRGWEGTHGDLPKIDEWEPAGVLQRIQSGEDEVTEFKVLLDQAKTYASLARTVAAFANGRGGVVFIGVSDHGEIVGADARIRRGVDDALAERVTPRAPYRWRALRLRGRPIQVLVVASAGTAVYRADRIVWTRVQATTREAEGDEIRHLAAQPSGTNRLE
jgi:hypothetical protein